MEILKEFDFDHREPKSQWAPYIDTLINGVNGKHVHAIRLVLGEDISEETGLANAYTGLSRYARKVERSARIRQFDKADPPYLVVGLRPEGEEPKKVRRAKKSTRPAPAAA
jgi:hypothetical protein